MDSEKKVKTETSFEQDLDKLEGIVNALEEGKLPLDEALRHFESGIGLVRKCEKTLSEAERKIEMLVRGLDGELKAQTFEESVVLSEEKDDLKTNTSQALSSTSEVRKIPLKKPKARNKPPSEEEISGEVIDDDDTDELF
jgi:exodeoxyribonuclease VII small subunit